MTVKHTFKRTLAFVIALMFAIPGMAVTEPADDVVVTDEMIVVDDVFIEGESDASDEDVDLFVEEMGEVTLRDLAEDPEADPEAGEDEAPEAPAPFDRSAEVGDITVAVTAGAGAFPEGSELRAGRVKDKDLA